MEHQAAFTEPVKSPPTPEQGSEQSGDCVESPAAETRTLVQAPEEPENPVDHSEQLENPVHACEQPMHSELVENLEVQELTNPGLDEAQFSVSETDGMKTLPSYVSEALYVTDLHPLAIDNVGLLQELFNQVGDVSIIRVIPKPADTAGRPPFCSAYVNFHKVEDACHAWQTLNYHVWMGLPMRIMFSNLDPATRYNENANIIVMNLEESIDSQFLHQTFCKLGVVLSSKVELDPSGKSTGRGFIQFQDEADAMKAIEQVKGEELRGKKVYVGPFLRRTYPSEAGMRNKNPLDLNPAHNPHFEVDNLSQVLKNEARLVAKNGSHDVLFGSSSNSANGSHGFPFGSFEPAYGSHDLGATYEALSFQISRSGGSTWNFNTQSGGLSNKERRKIMGRATSAERNKARRLAIIEKGLKEIMKEKMASPQDSETPVDPSDVPSSEPWPPQPWSVETLKARLAKAHCTEERLAMLGGTLFSLVSKQTKYFASDVTNELVKLDIEKIEKIMKLSEEALYQKVEKVKQVIFKRIKNLPPFVPITKPSPTPAAAHYPAASVEVPEAPNYVEEVKHVIFEETKNLPPFVPTTAPSLTPAADDPAESVKPLVVPDFPVPIVPEFLQAPSAPGCSLGIPLIPYTPLPPLLPLPVVLAYFPASVLNYTGYRPRPGTGFYEPLVSCQAGLYCLAEELGEGQEDEFTLEAREDPVQKEKAMAAEESAPPAEQSAQTVEELVQVAEVSPLEEQAKPAEQSVNDDAPQEELSPPSTQGEAAQE